MTSRRSAALLAALVVFASGARAAAPDVETIVRVAAERQQARERLAQPLAFDLVDVLVERDARGRAKSVERHVYRSFSRGHGVESRELVSVDGRPPTDDEREEIRKEDEKRRRHRAAHAAAGDPADDDDLRAGHLPLSDLLARFEFHLLGEETCEGRLAYLVSFGPRADRKPKTIRDRVLDQFAGRAWIDVAELEMLRLDGRLSRPVKVAGGLALELSEVRLLYEALPLAPGRWEPCLEELHVDATAGLVFHFRRDVRFEFSNYRGVTPPGAAAAPSRAAASARSPGR